MLENLSALLKIYMNLLKMTSTFPVYVHSVLHFYHIFLLFLTKDQNNSSNFELLEFSKSCRQATQSLNLNSKNAA